MLNKTIIKPSLSYLRHICSINLSLIHHFICGIKLLLFRFIRGRTTSKCDLSVLKKFVHRDSSQMVYVIIVQYLVVKFELFTWEISQQFFSSIFIAYSIVNFSELCNRFHAKVHVLALISQSASALQRSTLDLFC